MSKKEAFSRQLCLDLDIQGYSRGNDVQQARAQADLLAMVDNAAQAVGLDRGSWSRQQKGDEELSFIPPGEREDVVVDQFMRELDARLYRWNRDHPVESRLRIRAAVDYGMVQPASLGFAGRPAVTVGRLMNSAAARRALERVPNANLVVVLSRTVYRDLVLGGHTTLRTSQFLQVTVQDKEVEDQAWLWLPGHDGESLKPVLADLCDSPSRSRVDGFGDLVAPKVKRLRDTLVERPEASEDLQHTLEVFRAVVHQVDARSPITAYGSAAEVALAYVLTESTIIHRHGTPNSPGADFACVARSKRDLEVLVNEVTGLDEVDIETLRRVVEQLTLVEPENIKRVTALQSSPASRCFTVLWGLGQLALMLDNPHLMGDELPSTAASRCAVLRVGDVDHDGRIHLDLAADERTGFHLAAEAHHAVRRYLSELEDVWRRAHLMPPIVRFELHTPKWNDRKLDVHEIRVDPRPITRLLMGRALYGNRLHVWLRELIQNASDATGMRATSEPGHHLIVEVLLLDPHTVIIRDNGVGMNRQQVLTQLAVLGRSGWRDNTSLASEIGDGTAFFGRFGIGFASVFAAASSVTVLTRTADMPSTRGIAVRFAGPDRPFYTEPATCEVGTEIRVTLTESISNTEFHEAMVDLFAYLPPHVQVLPDLRLPSSLEVFSSLTGLQQKLNGWKVFERSTKARLGPHEIGFKVEVLYDDKAHKRKNPYQGLPEFPEIGHTATTFCVDGVRVTRQWGLKPTKQAQTTNQRHDGAEDLHLSGCYVTVDFGRDTAPVSASRNAVDLDEGTQREFERLVRREVGALLPDLVATVKATCLTDRARHDAVYRVLSHLLARFRYYRSSYSDRSFHDDPDLNEAAATAYRYNCPVPVESETQKEHHRLLPDIDPTRCSTAVLKSLTAHPVFPAFVRSTGLAEWLVADDERELILIEQSWPHEEPLRVLDEASQLYEDFQTVLPEIREGHLWELLRADYGLSEGSAFGDVLCLPLPGRKGAVPRDVGLARRRSHTSSTERPRMMLNRSHEVVAVLEAHLDRTGDVDAVQDWLDRLCKDVLDETSQRAINALLPQLHDRLTAITGVRLRRFSISDLRM